MPIGRCTLRQLADSCHLADARRATWPRSRPAGDGHQGLRRGPSPAVDVRFGVGIDPTRGSPVAELWGGETRKAVENFPVSGERVPLPGGALAGPDQGRRGPGQRRARPARRRRRRADRHGGRRRGRGRARRPVPDRRLPDRVGHVVEHERQRGDRDPRRRRRPRQRPREHGAELERRLPVGGPPGRARGDLAPAAAGPRAPRGGAGDQGRGVRRRRQGRAAPT